MGEIRKIVIMAKGKSEPFYECRFTIDENKVFVDCTCMAGVFGMMCKHRVELIQGNTKYLFNNKELTKLQEINRLLENTPVYNEILRLKKIISEMDRLKAESKLLKEKIADMFADGIPLLK